MKLAIVCPCYNEEAVLAHSTRRLLELLDTLTRKGRIQPTSFVLLVNDGSRDTTWRQICDAHQRDARIRGANLLHNVGHQYALMAGLMLVREDCDAAISIDVDLQDDLQAIPAMIEAFHQGHDVVYGVKVNRQADPFLKRKTAVAFYRLQRWLGVHVIHNHADFRLMSNSVLNQLAGYSERLLYLRGLMPKLANNPAVVDDVISVRPAGESKYTPMKSLALALDGITSFSIRPLRLITLAGILFVLISLLIGGYVLYSLFTHVAVPGWSSLMFSVWLIGGMMLVGLGTVGEYIGKIYIEVKRRPRYQVGEYLGGNASFIESAQAHDS